MKRRRADLLLALGVLIQRRATEIASPAAGLAARTVWNALQFAGTALVFLLVGLLTGEFTVVRQPAEVIWLAATVVLLLIGLRFARMFVVPRATRAETTRPIGAVWLWGSAVHDRRRALRLRRHLAA